MLCILEVIEIFIASTLALSAWGAKTRYVPLCIFLYYRYHRHNLTTTADDRPAITRKLIGFDWLESLHCLYNLGAFVPGRARGSQWAIALPRSLVDATNGQLYGGLETTWTIHERHHYCARTPARGGDFSALVDQSVAAAGAFGPSSQPVETEVTKVPEDVTADRPLGWLGACTWMLKLQLKGDSTPSREGIRNSKSEIR